MEPVTGEVYDIIYKHLTIDYDHACISWILTNCEDAIIIHSYENDGADTYEYVELFDIKNKFVIFKVNMKQPVIYKPSKLVKEFIKKSFFIIDSPDKYYLPHVYNMRYIVSYFTQLYGEPGLNRFLDYAAKIAKKDIAYGEIIEFKEAMYLHSPFNSDILDIIYTYARE